jgi:hypothetical protein
MNIQESSILLNRLGIILNLIAGFLIAPELIGEERLKRFEIWMKERLHRINKKTDINRYAQELSHKGAILKASRISTTNPAIRAQLEAMEKSQDLRNNLYNLILIGLWIILYETIEFQTHKFVFILTAIGILAIIGLIKLSIETNIILHIRLFENFLLYLVFIIIDFFMNFLFFVFGIILRIFIFVLFFFAVPIMYLLFQLTRLTIHILQGRERVKSLVISLGIFFFIVGSMLQFVATFGN